MSKAYEITKDKEKRTELYASTSSIDAALKPGETLRQCSDGLLNYDKSALDNFNKAASALNVMVKRVDNILGRPMDTRAEAVAYRSRQEKLLGEGKLMDAIQIDIEDVRSKYDVGIKQMPEYASTLNPNDFRK